MKVCMQSEVSGPPVLFSRKRYGSVLCLERSGGGSTPPRVTNLTEKVLPESIRAVMV